LSVIIKIILDRKRFASSLLHSLPARKAKVPLDNVSDRHNVSVAKVESSEPHIVVTDDAAAA